MKKSILLVLVSLMFLNCGDEIEFNTPAFQGDRENRLWRAKKFSTSTEENGSLTITGTYNLESVSLKVNSIEEGIYSINNENTNEAGYSDGFGTRFSTTNTPDESISIYPELGEIVIEEIDVANGTITGTFRFLAFDVSGLNSVGYTNGIFFKVPLDIGAFN